jgi:hypothetical protein
VRGGTTEHRLEAIEGGIGTGTIELQIDGLPALMLAGPTELQPTVVSAPGVLDDREVALYVDSPDGGQTVTCDLYLDRISLNTGRPMTSWLRARSLGLISQKTAPRGLDMFPALVAVFGLGAAVAMPHGLTGPIVRSLLAVTVVVGAEVVVSLQVRR